MSKSITVDGVEYVQADSVAPAGPRVVLVLDRGWVFAGDVTDKDGRIMLTNALQVRNWSGIGFEGMIANPNDDKVTLKTMTRPVDVPQASELYRIPVEDDWGL